jgi:hypothetical protein
MTQKAPLYSVFKRRIAFIEPEKRHPKERHPGDGRGYRHRQAHRAIVGRSRPYRLRADFDAMLEQGLTFDPHRDAGRRYYSELFAAPAELVK